MTLFGRVLRALPTGSALVLCACSSNSVAPDRMGAPTAPLGDPVYAQGGIDVGTTGLEIGFGRAEPGAIRAMSRLLGDTPKRVVSSCPGMTAAAWRNGAVLYFDRGDFVGWAKDGQSAGRVCP